MGLISENVRWKDVDDYLDDFSKSHLWRSFLDDMQQTATAKKPGYHDELKKEALKNISYGEATGRLIMRYWEIYHHDLRAALIEVWDDIDVTPAVLNLIVCGLMILMWMEQHLPAVDEEVKKIAGELLNSFYSVESAAVDYVKTIKGWKDRQITEYTNKLIENGVISDMSCKRDIWKVLYKYNIYKCKEPNWRNQITARNSK